MFYKNKRLAIFIMLVIIAAVGGCASAPPDKDEWDPFKLVWPLPPEKPRIKYTASLKNEEDLASSKGFAQSLFGEEKSDALIKPYGVTSDEKGNVYVSDSGRVFIFDRKNKKMSFIEHAGGIKLKRPLGLFFDNKNDLLYVADTGVDRVFVLRPNGKLVMTLGERGELVNPTGVVADQERKRIYVVNTKKHSITIYDSDGKFLKDVGGFGGDPGAFNLPTQIAINKKGDIYVVDSANFRVQQLDYEGNPIRVLGGIGTNFGQFARPKGVSVSPEGYIYVTDTTHSGVTIFAPDGKLLLTWGNDGIAKGLFQIPAGIHVDENGLVYVVSQWTGRVDIFQQITYPEDKELIAPKGKELTAPAEKK